MYFIPPSLQDFVRRISLGEREKLVNIMKEKRCDSKARSVLLNLVSYIKTQRDIEAIEIIINELECSNADLIIELAIKMVDRVDITLILNFLENFLASFTKDEIYLIYSKRISKEPRAFLLLPFLSEDKLWSEFISLLNAPDTRLGALLIFPRIEGIIVRENRPVVEVLKDVLLKLDYRNEKGLRAFAVGLFLLNSYDHELARQIIAEKIAIIRAKSNSLLALLGSSVNRTEARALAWLVSEVSQVFNIRLAISTLVQMVESHGDIIILDVSKAITDLVRHFDIQSTYYLVRRLSRSKLYILRLLATHIAGNLSSDVRFIGILKRLLLDRRSEVRKTAASYIIKRLNESNMDSLDKSELEDIILKLITSGHAETIVSTLHIISERKFEPEFVERVLKKVLADFRTSVIESALKVIESYYTELNRELITKSLSNLIDRFRTKKQLLERIEEILASLEN